MYKFSQVVKKVNKENIEVLPKGKGLAKKQKGFVERQKLNQEYISFLPIIYVQPRRYGGFSNK